MAKKKNKLVPGYYDANSGTRVTNANIVEDTSGWRIEKNKLDNLNTQSSVSNLSSPITRSKILAPTPQETMTINSINNKINENISKKIVSGGIQNDIHNMNMANIGTKNNKVTFQSAYKDTGKKYGDYYYDNYESFKDKPIYERDGKYFLKTNKGYEPVGKLDKDGNVKTDIEFEKKDNSISKDKKFTKNQDVNLIGKYEEDKKELQKAESLGYKDNLTKITSKEYDDAQKVLKEYKEQMKMSDKDYKNWLKTGKLPKNHGYVLYGDKLPDKAENYRKKINSGEIKKYDQQGFDVEKQIYMDTHNMSDDQKQQYISFITGKNAPTQNTKSTFFKSSESDNPVGTTLGTIGHAATTLAKGIGNFIEGGGDFALNLLGSSMETSAIASIGNKKKDVTTIKNNVEYTGYQLDNKKYWYDKKNDKLYDENWNRIQSFNLDRFQKQYTYSNGIAEFGRQMKEQTVKDDTSEAFDEVLHGNDLRKASVLGNKSEAMLESMGQALPLMGAGGSVGGLYGNSAAVATTSGLTFSSTYGNAKTEAIRNGATEKEAMETAFVQASAETISEQFFDSIPGAKSAGWGEKLVGKVGNGVEKYLGSKTAKIVTKTLDISGEGFEEIISNMLTAGGNDIVHYFDSDYSYGMENQTGNILEDMKSAMTSQDSMDSFISAIITSAILNGGSAKVNSAKINKIVKTYAQEYNMSIEEAKARLKISDDGIEFDTSNINQNNNTPNLPKIENDTQEKYSNVKPPMVIKYQETDNERINNFRQSAVKEGMIDSQKTTNAMNVIEKVISDKDYNVRFDRTITNSDGKSVDGKININKNGEVEIALNPNSDRAVEFLLTHEVTHAIETKELRGIILDYAKKNPEFNNALKDLQKTYGTTNVNDEVIADISGQILGNQEFINSLSMQNTEQSRGFISKVYHSIQRLLNKLTTKGRYRNFVEDLETKWREAYRLATNETAINNLQNDSKYMMISVKGMNNGVNTNNRYWTIKERYEYAQYLKRSGEENNEYIRQKTGWFQDKEGNWEFEISDHNTDFKINPEPNTQYKMSDLFKAKTLYELYPELKDIKVTFKEMKSNGSYFPLTNNINIDNELINNRDEARGTLLHEIQHYIQKVEDLPEGTSLKFGYENYANSKGEIEAADTKRRMKMSVEEREQIIPESSKKIPVHPERDYILSLEKEKNKKSIVEKIGNKLYNVFGGKSYEIAEEIKEKNVKDNNRNNWNRLEELDNSSFSLQKRYDDIINQREYLRQEIQKLRKQKEEIIKEIPNYSIFKKYDELTGIDKLINENLEETKKLYNQKQELKEKIDIIKETQNQKEIDEINKYGSQFKREQLNIIKQSNPMLDDYHVGIRNVSDIKTFDEVINDEESFAWGDYTRDDAIRDLKNGYVTVYSSYPIKNGVFVSTSYQQAFEYAGHDKSKVHQKKVPLNEVAWINGDEGQYAKVEDTKYSQESSTWKEHLDKNYKPTGTRTYFDEITNKKIAPINHNATTNQNKVNPPIAKEYQKNTIAEKIEKNDNVIKVQAEEIANQLNSGKPLNTKERRWIETSTESDILKNKVFKEDLDVNKINYEIQSNKKSLREANEKLDLMGYDKSINYVKNLIDDGKIPTASDVALAQRTLQEAAKKGDTEVVKDLVMDVAILGTELGQATQALSIINKLTPEGQLKLYSKIVHRAKLMGDKSFQDVEITPEMVEMILNAYDKNGNYDQNDLNNRVEQFKQKVADQLKTSVEEKIDAWRYLSMLGNPKTHIRNIISNVAMKCTIAYKNALARTIETFAPINTRTKTWKKSSQEVKQYAKETAIEMKDVITGETKYGEQASIESKKRIFKFAPLENISNLNSNLLEAEDWLFSKSAFINTFQEYLTANGIKTMDDIKNNPEIVEKGKLYSVEQAEIATFRQYSKLASAINKIERNNKVAKYAIKATVPFKKTPINVAKAGVKYSPLGLIKNVTYDIYQVKKGNINASQFIDNLSQGLSGTSLTILGYALAKAGILTGSGGNDKDDKYDSYLGKQGYSIKIGNKYYSLSWLSPTAMPMFVGANIHEQFEEQKGWDMNILSESLTKTLDPLNEMSFVSSLTDALNSYGSNNDKIKGMGESVAQSYIGQFFPTLFSQFANVGDDTKRSTKASSNSSYKFGEQTIRSIMYKIPGLRNKLEPSTDIWGNEIKQNENILMRALESFILPYSAKEYKNSNIDKEIKKVYNDVGDTKIIPGYPQSYVKYSNEQYRMSAKEYTKYKKTYGTSANTMLNMLMNTSNYKNSTGKRKTRMIKKVYDYSREISQEEFLSNRNIDYDKKKFKYKKNDYEKIVNYITSSTQYKDDD